MEAFKLAATSTSWMPVGQIKTVTELPAKSKADLIHILRQGVYLPSYYFSFYEMDVSIFTMLEDPARYPELPSAMKSFV
jgi:hypothetical protein